MDKHGAAGEIRGSEPCALQAILGSWNLHGPFMACIQCCGAHSIFWHDVLLAVPVSQWCSLCQMFERFACAACRE